jgi:Ca-activated chloride channel family protein
MSKDNKMDLLQKSMNVLLERLRPIDRVALFTFGNFPDLLYSTTSFSGPDSLKKILRKVRSTASATNVNGGIEEAYERARSVFMKQANNEVLLITDGEFILNKHTAELVRNAKDINMTCVIVGTDAGAIKAGEYVKNTLQLNLVTLVNEATDLNVLLESVKSRASTTKDKTE